MIPRAHVTAWRAKAPWSSDAQVEQDDAPLGGSLGEDLPIGESLQALLLEMGCARNRKRPSYTG